MMQAMMTAMIRSLSAKEKEALMLRMMPMMMTDVDLNKLVPNMARTMGQLLTLYAIYDFLAKAAKSPDLTGRLSEAHQAMMTEMPHMAPALMPVMEGVMSKAVPGVLPMMSTMIAEMDKKDSCIVADIVGQDLKLNPLMGEIMLKMAPRMAGKVVPKDKRQSFLGRFEKKFAEN